MAPERGPGGTTASPASPEDEAADATSLRRRLEAAIDGLPPIYRCVFMLRAVQELSVDETPS